MVPSLWHAATRASSRLEQGDRNAILSKTWCTHWSWNCEVTHIFFFMSYYNDNNNNNNNYSVDFLTKVETLKNEFWIENSLPLPTTATLVTTVFMLSGCLLSPAQILDWSLFLFSAVAYRTSPFWIWHNIKLLLLLNNIYIYIYI